MTITLKNLRPLRDDMIEKDWTISCFEFTYKQCNYVVLVKLFDPPIVKQSKFALAQLEFLDKKDLKRNYVVEANSSGLLDEPKNIRKYFGIKYGQNMGDTRGAS